MSAPKLSLALRKEVRDEFESKKPTLESELSSVVGTPWTIEVDVAHLHTFVHVNNNFPRDSPGRMTKQYIENAIRSIKEWVEKTGKAGQDELNSLASSHILSIKNTENPKVSVSGCSIEDGKLWILFTKDCLGCNMPSALNELQAAVNDAGIAQKGVSGAGLDFDAKHGITTDYDPKIGALLEKARTILAMPTFVFKPNFEANFVALKQAEIDGTRLNRSWQSSFGKETLDYWVKFIEYLEDKNFAKDDMLQEGFQEAVSTGELSVKVVPALNKKGDVNDCALTDGVLIFRTTPEYWTYNKRNAPSTIMDLL